MQFVKPQVEVSIVVSSGHKKNAKEALVQLSKTQPVVLIEAKLEHCLANPLMEPTLDVSQLEQSKEVNAEQSLKVVARVVQELVSQLEQSKVVKELQPSKEEAKSVTADVSHPDTSQVVKAEQPLKTPPSAVMPSVAIPVTEVNAVQPCHIPSIVVNPIAGSTAVTVWTLSASAAPFHVRLSVFLAIVIV